MPLGAHVSAAGGVEESPQRGAAIGADAIQIFAKNQRQWKAKALTDEQCAAFKAARKSHGIAAVVIHDSYLINLAAPDKALLERSRAGFVDELTRAHQLGVDGLVFHPGAHMGAGIDLGLERVAESIRACLDAAPGKARLLVENTAGQGSAVGFDFAHIGTLMRLVDTPTRMGMCIDTQHSFAAGYDLRTEAGYETVMTQVEQHVGTKNVRAFHINDSKKELGSHVDRHDNIGEGNLGLLPFWMLLHDRRFSKTPMVLETPGGDPMWQKEIALLRKLAQQDDPPTPKGDPPRKGSRDSTLAAFA